MTLPNPDAPTGDAPVLGGPVRDVPVLIAGGGPVGLALAVELGLRGVECLVVEPRSLPLMRRLGAEVLIVRPDQVVAAVWPPPATDHFDHSDNSSRFRHFTRSDHFDHSDRTGETDFLDTTMAMLCGRPRSRDGMDKIAAVWCAGVPVADAPGRRKEAL